MPPSPTALLLKTAAELIPLAKGIWDKFRERSQANRRATTLEASVAEIRADLTEQAALVRALAEQLQAQAVQAGRLQRWIAAAVIAGGLALLTSAATLVLLLTR